MLKRLVSREIINKLVLKIHLYRILKRKEFTCFKTIFKTLFKDVFYVLKLIIKLSNLHSPMTVHDSIIKASSVTITSAAYWEMCCYKFKIKAVPSSDSKNFIELCNTTGHFLVRYDFLELKKINNCLKKDLFIDYRLSWINMLLSKIHLICLNSKIVSGWQKNIQVHNNHISENLFRNYCIIQ